MPWDKYGVAVIVREVEKSSRMARIQQRLPSESEISRQNKW
jgi:hypothetical protein